MGSNSNPDTQQAMDQSSETTQHNTTADQSRNDPPQATRPQPASDPTTTVMNDSPAQPDTTSQTPAAQPAPEEPTKEALPETTDKEAPAASPTEEAHKTLSHTESLEPKFSTAIGPSSDHPDEPAKESDSSGPTLVITLLLTTGARHPFKIDGKYLRKRSVNVDNNDPFSMSVYTLKELIWREWRPGIYVPLARGSCLPSMGRYLVDKR